MTQELTMEARIHKWISDKPYNSPINLQKEIGAAKREEVLQMLKRLHDFDAWYFNNAYIEFSEDFTSVTKKRYNPDTDVLRFKF